MKKIIVSLSAIVCLANASDSSQATFGDIKEAVYKLIILNKTNIDKTERLDGKFNKLNKSISTTKKDFLDNYIEHYVASNEEILKDIKK